MKVKTLLAQKLLISFTGLGKIKLARDIFITSNGKN